MSVTIDYDNNMVRIVNEIRNNYDVAIRLMLEDIHRISTPMTPKRPDPIGGTLRTEIIKLMEGPARGSITWNAPYAEYQERGYGKTPFVHYSTPGTHAHFAQEAVETVVGRADMYFRQAGAIR